MSTIVRVSEEEIVVEKEGKKETVFAPAERGNYENGLGPLKSDKILFMPVWV